jgi:hemerythrin superfamily protein
MSSTSTSNQDVTQFILSQHEQVKSLFSQIGAGKGKSAEDAFCQLRRLLAVHETAEEEIVYPVLRAQGDRGKQVVEARLAEESEGKTVLAELEELEVGSAEFEKTFEKFRSAVLEHATHEEQEVLPLLRESQTPDKLQSMGRMFDVAEKAAPTHPHPHGPDSALGNMIVGPAVAIMDRVRDAIKAKS